MLTQIVWQVCWVLLRWVLGVSKEMVSTALSAVESAKDLKHPDGTPYTGEEKKNYVLDALVQQFDKNAFGDSWKSTYSSLIDLAWSYIKSTVLK